MSLPGELLSDSPCPCHPAPPPGVRGGGRPSPERAPGGGCRQGRQGAVPGAVCPTNPSCWWDPRGGRQAGVGLGWIFLLAKDGDSAALMPPLGLEAGV